VTPTLLTKPWPSSNYCSIHTARGQSARREFEYVRNGTVDLLAGFRVNDGQVYGTVRLKHRSRECCELLALLDEQTPAGKPIHLILDPVSSHRSAAVAKWLDSHPQRTFVFHFLPVHASYLSLSRYGFPSSAASAISERIWQMPPSRPSRLRFMTTHITHLAHAYA